MALIGYTLLLPAQTFATSRSWSVFAEWMSEASWGTVLLTIGGLRIVALIINGAARATPHLRALGAFIASGVWFLLALGFNLSPIPGVISPAIYTPFFICDFWNFLTAAGEAGAVDEAHKKRGGKCVPS